jgi:hypothetical protein
MLAGSAALVAGVSMVAFVDLDLDTYRMPSRYFALPIQLDPKSTAKAERVLLHVSTDRGKSWFRIDQADPGSSRFTFLAPSNGVYWFVQQAVLRGGQAEPDRIDARTPGIVKVRVRSEESAAGQRPGADSAELRSRIEQVEKRILALEDRIEELELRERLRRLERRLAEMQAPDALDP